MPAKHNLKVRIPANATVLVNGVVVPISGETIMPCKGNNPNCATCFPGELPPKTRRCYENHKGNCWHGEQGIA